MSFSQKLITVQFDLANGNFEGGGNQATVSGLRCSVYVNNAGGVAQSNLELAIYGLPLSMMNQLSTVGTQAFKLYQNGISVQAGEAGNLSLVFEGNITEAWTDGTSMPQVCFRVRAAPGTYRNVKPAIPLSKPGPADVSQLMQGLAKDMGLGFEDAGVRVKITDPYYDGTAWTQMLRIARHAGIDVTTDRGTLAIVPSDKARQGDAVLISPQTGMRGYPAFNQNRLVIQALFNPAVKMYGNIQVQSDLTPACGTWKVASLVYELESLTPHGKWFMTITAVDGQPTIS